MVPEGVRQGVRHLRAVGLVVNGTGGGSGLGGAHGDDGVVGRHAGLRCQGPHIGPPEQRILPGEARLGVGRHRGGIVAHAHDRTDRGRVRGHDHEVRRRRIRLGRLRAGHRRCGCQKHRQDESEPDEHPHG